MKRPGDDYKSVAEAVKIAKEALQSTHKKYKKKATEVFVEKLNEMELRLRVTNAECLLVALIESKRDAKEKKVKTHTIEKALNLHSPDGWPKVNSQLRAKAQDMKLLT